MKKNSQPMAKNLKKLFLIFLIPFLFNACAIFKDGKNKKLNPGEISFIILQLNDVYEIAPLEKGKVGGLARVATVRKQLLEENPNVLTVHAGDFLNPSLIGTMKYEGEGIKGRQMVEVMNGIGVDVVAYGNHEFDIEEGELQKRMDESDFEWIGTNVMHKDGGDITPFYKMKNGAKQNAPEYFIWEAKNPKSGKTMKIGFYSACINSNQADYVYYENQYDEAKKAFFNLEKETSLVLGLTHLSIEEDMKMAAILPATGLIMGGHEHENSRDTVGRVVITKADANAKTVYVHRFTYNILTKETICKSELVPITDKIIDDPQVAATVDKWQTIQNDQISEVVVNPDEVIYTAIEPLDGREISVRNKQTNLAGLISAGMSAASKLPAACAIFNGGAIRLDDQLTGDITAVDIFRAMPFGGSIWEIDLKGDILKRALDAGLENAGIGGYLQWHNIEYIEGGKSWKVSGEPLDVVKTYHIIASDYLSSGKEQRLDFFNPDNFIKVEKPKDGDNADLRSDIRKATIEYMKSL